MTTVALRVTGRHVRSARLGAAAGGLLVLVLMLTFGFVASSSRPGGATLSATELASRRAAVADWEAAVRPLIVSGGEIVALGPRVAVGQIRDQSLPDAVMAGKASRWITRLTALTEQIAAVPTPAPLREAHDLLGAAMRGYLTASRDLLAATRATGTRRADLLTAAAAAGTAADHTYDQAMAAVARLRTQLGLPTDWSG